MKSLKILNFLVIVLGLGLMLSSPIFGSANWKEKFGEPKYGRSITHAPGMFTANFDPYNGMASAMMYYCESLWMIDWALDRDIWSFQPAFIPDEYMKGCLAESWEMTDPQTIIVHLRKGIKWQSKPPVNGREFTASDVEYHYDRMLGAGSGFTEPSPLHKGRLGKLEKATAKDKYTVVFKFTDSGILNLSSTVMEPDARNVIEAREVIDKYGNAQDWRNAVGTGPWILKEYVEGSSLKYEKNPNYWGRDERFPKNQLPYADTLTVLNIQDLATRLAALRTGKIDFVDGINLQQAQTLAESNPELKQVKIPFINTYGINMNIREAPFNDIRVRKAMQMALDRDLIGKTYFGGQVDGKPCGWVHPLNKGYCYAYRDWPQKLKDEYSYNPEKAKKLLAEAGYPDGFMSTILMGTDADMALVQVIKSQFKDIGIEMEINAVDPVTERAMGSAFKYKMYWNRITGSTASPPIIVRMNYSSAPFNFTRADDPAYDAMCDQLVNATSMDEVKNLCVQLDKYDIERHWGIRLFPINTYNIWQPNLKGYSGENMGRPGFVLWARFWKE